MIVLNIRYQIITKSAYICNYDCKIRYTMKNSPGIKLYFKLKYLLNMRLPYIEAKMMQRTQHLLLNLEIAINDVYQVL